MVRSGEKLLNDLIIFLTACPYGLDMAEVQILLQRFPTELSPEARNCKIKLYIDLFREASKKGDGEMPQIEASSENCI